MKVIKVRGQKGFTVLELLISTVVFGVLLLIVSVAIVGLTRNFYRGVNKSKTQETARTISEQIAKAIQYSKTLPQSLPSAGSPPNTVQGWCISNTRYAFVESRQLGTGAGQSPAVLVRGPTCSNPAAPLTRGANETEMMGEGMRLANLEITPDSTGEVWSVRVRVVMGEDDLVCSPSAGDCAATTTSTNQTATDLACKQFAGSQFCAVAEYSAIVVRRL
jgi:prepilin-type N-terminal cleavage/methylation domain-containing protein